MALSRHPLSSAPLSGSSGAGVSTVSGDVAFDLSFPVAATGFTGANTGEATIGLSLSVAAAGGLGQYATIAIDLAAFMDNLLVKAKGTGGSGTVSGTASFSPKLSISSVGFVEVNGDAAIEFSPLVDAAGDVATVGRCTIDLLPSMSAVGGRGASGVIEAIFSPRCVAEGIHSAPPFVPIDGDATIAIAIAILTDVFGRHIQPVSGAAEMMLSPIVDARGWRYVEPDRSGAYVRHKELPGVVAHFKQEVAHCG